MLFCENCCVLYINLLYEKMGGKKAKTPPIDTFFEKTNIKAHKCYSCEKNTDNLYIPTIETYKIITKMGMEK